MSIHKKEFKPRAKLLLELGNQLIKDEGIAVFELVKNSYDADSNKVSVTLEHIDNKEKGRIIIEDDGVGMNLDTVLNVWMEPGTDFRKRQLDGQKRSKLYNRLPLGEKGIGRFGAHKLGNRIKLFTKAKNEKEVQVEIDWRIFEQDKYLDQIEVSVEEVNSGYFDDKQSGTRIEMTDLSVVWDRGMVRDLHRAINSICSPFKKPDSFEVTLLVVDDDKSDWLNNLLTWDEVVKYSLFKATCKISKDTLNYKYKFSPWDTMQSAKSRSESMTLKLKDPEDKGEILDLSKYKIGDIELDLYIYDFDSKIMSSFDGDKSGLKKFLKQNGGIRVYRDNVRVYDYGEEGNDWLGLDVRRVNTPASKISNNLILGEVRINRKGSSDLVEKTNREGFIENPSAKILRKSILFTIAQIESEREKDKKKLRQPKDSQRREPVIDDLNDLRKKLAEKKILKDFESDIEKVERSFLDVKERLLTSAGAGLSLSIVIHEVQKIIAELKLVAKKEKTADRIRELITRLSEVTEGYSMLIRKEGKKSVLASELLRQAKFNVEYRLEAHHIKIVEDYGDNDFTVTCNRRLIVGALMNLIDNSIWWLEQNVDSKKVIYLALSNELKKGPAIVIADSGPGFIDEPEYLTQPFFTRKPNGLGLGLHIADEIMKVHKGKLQILQKGDVKLPPAVKNGAAVALIFSV